MEAEATVIPTTQTLPFPAIPETASLTTDVHEFDPLPEPDAPQEMSNITATRVVDETALRNEWAERIREEKRLPAGLRDRLANVVAEATSDVSSGPEPRLTISQVANLFAETLPSFLTTAPQVVEHPQGERFFQGEAVTTEEAATIARRQLERTGFHREP